MDWERKHSVAPNDNFGYDWSGQSEDSWKDLKFDNSNSWFHCSQAFDSYIDSRMYHRTKK